MPFQSDDQRLRFIEVLNEEYDWPDYYLFKFIIKTANKSELLKLLVGYKIEEKLSRNGNYTSISARALVQSAEEICDIYEKVKVCEGIISL
ncbi:MAG: DUF493 family protein [Bacteriovoracaceae bacterium]|nr:DUF493 family protein [Bacteriovoracaceae bacterium]